MPSQPLLFSSFDHHPHHRHLHTAIFSFPSKTAMIDDDDAMNPNHHHLPKFPFGGAAGFKNLRFDTAQSRLEADEDSGVCSPPLWKTSAPSSPNRSPSPPRGRRNLSPSSRTQAIARGRKELMEMVRHMPEATYELSLKDLVEHHHTQKNQLEAQDHGAAAKSKYEKSDSAKKAQMKRSESVDNGGFLLKLVFPFNFWGSKKKKKTKTNTKKKKSASSVNTGCAKVSPKPSPTTSFSGSDGSVRGGEEWWKKRSNASGESSSSGGGSKNSSSSTKSSGHAVGFLPRCWAYFRSAWRSKSV